MLSIGNKTVRKALTPTAADKRLCREFLSEKLICSPHNVVYKGLHRKL